MSVKLNSTKAKVRDPEKVREILDSYEWQGMEIELQDEGAGWILTMSYLDIDWESWEWPRALRLEDLSALPSEDQYPNEDDFFETEFNLYQEKGEEGLLALLRELAPHLESSLLIVVVTASPSDGFYYAARVWRVEPGAKEVETLEI
jgi:hypothetical protein